MYNAAVRHLTLWYVAALLVVCLGFSTLAYEISVQRLQRGAERQSQIILNMPPPSQGFDFPDLRAARDREIEQDRSDLIKNLLLINILVVGVGAYLSYIFAKRTLLPLQEAHEMQSRFTADASHELRTPLAIMQTEIEVALRDKQLSSSGAKEILTSNLEELTRLQQLSNQLLALTRLEDKALVRRTINWSDQVTKSLARLEKQYGVTFSTQIAKNLKVDANGELLDELLNVLVDNAVNYRKEDTPIEVILVRRSRQVFLTVHNEGPPIKSADMAHIFERFYRGRNATGSGHGLGLALVKVIVEQHHGAINVTSTAKGGTTFSLHFPEVTT